jgi:dihydropyrimidinase
VLDLAVVGGKVVSPDLVLDADVGIRDGRVVQVVARGELTEDVQRRLDATGRYVVPGGIDAHVHFNLMVTPVMSAQSSSAGSRAAAYGGTTTFIDFVLQSGEQSLVAAIEGKHKELEASRPHVDYGLHAMLTGSLPFSVMDEIPEAISGGVSSFKMFTTFSGASASGDLYSDDGRIWGVMCAAEAHDGIVMVHAEDDCIIDYNVRRLYAAGEQDGRNIPRARPPLAEEAAIRRMLLLSRRSGCPLYIVHVSSTPGVQAIGEAKMAGFPVYGEVLHNYLTFTSGDYAGEAGPLYHNYPPLKSVEDQASLWRAVTGNALDTIASDDFTVPRAGKLAGRTVDNVTGGHNGIETRMNVVFSEGVAKGRLSVQRFVEITSTNPAKLFGLYPRKGILAVGSDADLAVIDPDSRVTLRLEDLHSDCDYSLWDGWQLQGAVRATVLRGQVLVEDGQWQGPTAIGQFLPAGRPAGV